jgi:hypothetical protein
MKKAIIDKRKFAIVKAKERAKAWACIQDGREITLIIEESKLKDIKKIRTEKNFRLITFDMVLPFGMTGFISKIATKLAEAKIPIFVISAYSTDHILIKHKYLNKAINCLIALGFEIKNEKQKNL